MSDNENNSSDDEYQNMDNEINKKLNEQLDMEFQQADQQLKEITRPQSGKSKNIAENRQRLKQLQEKQNEDYQNDNYDNNNECKDRDLNEQYEYNQQSNFQKQKEQDEEQISDSLERLNQVINMNHINLENFWKSDQISVTMNEFVHFMSLINLYPDENEIQELQQDLADEYNKVYLKIVCNKIKPWKAQENAMLEFIQQRALNIAQSSKKRATQQFKIQKQDKNRPRTANYSAGRPISAITAKSYKTKASGISELREIPKPREAPKNKSKYYLQKFQEKQKETDRLLKLTINKGKNEYEYEMLINMGDANEISQKLNSKVTYRAYKDANGDLKVHVYEFDKFLKQLTLEEFQREYNLIKNKYNEKQNKNIWEHLSENKKNQGQKTFSKGGMEDDYDEHELNRKGFKNNERVQDLKKVLLDTMVLTNILKEQLAVLNRKGINQQANQQQNKNNHTFDKSSSQFY